MGLKTGYKCENFDIRKCYEMISAFPIVPEDDVDPNLIGFRYLLDFKTIDKSLNKFQIE